MILLDRMLVREGETFLGMLERIEKEVTQEEPHAKCHKCQAPVEEGDLCAVCRNEHYTAA